MKAREESQGRRRKEGRSRKGAKEGTKEGTKEGVKKGGEGRRGGVGYFGGTGDLPHIIRSPHHNII
jgi:hypothetical protein